jgi:hypothetical protein
VLALGSAGHAPRPREIARMATRAFGVTVNKNWGKKWIERHVEYIGPKASKKLTAGRADSEKILDAAPAWAESYAEMLAEKFGLKGNHRVLSIDETYAYMLADSALNIHIVDAKTERAQVKSMSRTSVASIAPVVVGDGTVLCVFVNVKSKFPKIGPGKETAPSGEIRLNVPIEDKTTRSAGAPVVRGVCARTGRHRRSHVRDTNGVTVV